MRKWLEDNPAGAVLAAISGFLLLVLLVLLLLSLVPLRTGDAGDGVADDAAAIDLPQLGESPPIDNYYVITERPLFNESRQPIIEEELDQEAMAGPVEDEVELPDVELSGVILTPSLRMATLKRKDATGSVVAFEGRPIEGEFGSWQVSQIDPRHVTLTSGEGKQLRLELQVYDKTIEQPKRPEPAGQETAEESAAAPRRGESGEPLSRAEEIRLRIAERREELRRQAEEEDEAGRQAAPPSYQEAIQSMINRGRTPDSENQDE